MIEKNNHVKIVDFGIAQFKERINSITKTGKEISFFKIIYLFI